MIAVLSDIHSNRQALEAVLADAAHAGADAVWCLGDTVGYGADPDAALARLAEAAPARWLAGNHDLGATGRIALTDFAAHARVALEWTMGHADPDCLAHLATLSPALDARLATPAGERTVALAHGSPRDPVWEYVLSGAEAGAAIDDGGADLTFVGHSHVALAAGPDASGTVRLTPARPGDTLDLAATGRRVVNPGSVGQPRDGDPRAAYAMVDERAGRLEFRRVAYDVEAAQRAIRDAGLPDMLADRLEVGR